MVAAVLFSTGGAVIKGDAFSAFQVSTGRSAIAALVLLVATRGRVRLSWASFAAAVPYAAMLTLFVAATKLTTAANAIFLQSTAPLFLLLIGRTFLRESVARRDVVDMMVMALGLTACLAGESAPGASAPNPVLGNALALLAAVAFAATLAGLRWTAVQDPSQSPLSPVILGNALAAVSLLPWAVPFPSADVLSWASLVYLGSIQIGVAYACLTSALRHLPAFEVSLLLLVEPVLNPVWTWLVRGERPSSLALVGGACILVSCARRTLGSRPVHSPQPG